MHHGVACMNLDTLLLYGNLSPSSSGHRNGLLRLDLRVSVLRLANNAAEGALNLLEGLVASDVEHTCVPRSETLRLGLCGGIGGTLISYSSWRTDKATGEALAVGEDVFGNRKTLLKLLVCGQ